MQVRQAGVGAGEGGGWGGAGEGDGGGGMGGEGEDTGPVVGTTKEYWLEVGLQVRPVPVTLVSTEIVAPCFSSSIAHDIAPPPDTGSMTFGEVVKVCSSIPMSSQGQKSSRYTTPTTGSKGQ